MKATSDCSAPGPRLFVDQPRAAARRELSQRGVNVVHPQRDVVQAGAALVGVLGDRRVGRGRFEQLQLGVANGNENARATRCDATSSGASTSRPSASR